MEGGHSDHMLSSQRLVFHWDDHVLGHRYSLQKNDECIQKQQGQSRSKLLIPNENQDKRIWRCDKYVREHNQGIGGDQKDDHSSAKSSHGRNLERTKGMQRKAKK